MTIDVWFCDHCGIPSSKRLETVRLQPSGKVEAWCANCVPTIDRSITGSSTTGGSGGEIRVVDK